MGQRERILVVEDDADAREMLGDALLHSGYAVDQAADGFDALARLIQGPTDLVLSDLHLPGMDGLELIRVLRERAFNQPVVLVTGWESRDLCTAAETYGAVACLKKPLHLDDLVWTIDRALACQTESSSARHR
jgi:DNA-binding response OmpR family regulator